MKVGIITFTDGRKRAAEMLDGSMFLSGPVMVACLLPIGTLTQVEDSGRTGSSYLALVQYLIFR